MKGVLISFHEEIPQRVVLDKEVFLIGRSEDNDLVLPRKYISRKHASIEQRGGKYIVRDLGGRNPTRINGRPIREHVLQQGDLLEICDFKFRFDWESLEEEEEDAV